MIFFIADVQNNKALFNQDESWHCAKVLRRKINDEVNIIDGKGNFYKGALSQVHEKHCIADILEGPVKQQRHDYYLHLAIAPTKQIERIEWMLEKAVEIGIDEISFLKCKNSERVNLKTERLQKIIESAVKQSKQAFIPKLNDICDFKNILASDASVKLIAHCEEGQKRSLKDLNVKKKKVLVLVGPEGDFSPDEIRSALQAEFLPVSLGETRLRTETAGLYVVQGISMFN